MVDEDFVEELHEESMSSYIDLLERLSFPCHGLNIELGRRDCSCAPVANYVPTLTDRNAFRNCIFAVYVGYTVLKARRGKTYLLRIVNAAVNLHLYFAVANHTLTVVEADAAYVYPFETSLIFLSPGQTTNVLLTADKGGGTYYMSVRGYGRDDIPIVRPVALFKYGKASKADVPLVPSFPAVNSTGIVTAFSNSLRTLYPGRVPLTVNRKLFLTVGLTQRPCSAPPVATNCTGLLRAQGAVNNVTFDEPEIAILQASYFNISGVFTEDFPDDPPLPFDYTFPTSPPPALRQSSYATRVIGINFNDTVQMALQDTMVLGFENHPFHLHGHNFYVLGYGFGNYVSQRDDFGLNLYDPPLRNTVSVPSGGWAVIRIKANNPGNFHPPLSSVCLHRLSLILVMTSDIF